MSYNKELIEELADYAHSTWSRWMKHLFKQCADNPLGSMIIPEEFVDRWKEQSKTPYLELSEKEKESDREEAVKILDIIEKERMKGHFGDCTIYAAMANGDITDGVCTCGYGILANSQGDPTKMYSDERLESMKTNMSKEDLEKLEENVQKIFRKD